MFLLTALVLVKGSFLFPVKSWNWMALEKAIHKGVLRWIELFWYRSHWEDIIGYEEGSRPDAFPHTPLTQWASSWGADGLDKDKGDRRVFYLLSLCVIYHFVIQAVFRGVLCIVLHIPPVERTWWTLSRAWCSWDSLWQNRGGARPPSSGCQGSVTSGNIPGDEEKYNVWRKVIRLYMNILFTLRHLRDKPHHQL